ncbi:MAG: polymer-forming cytoskeletal protein [Spirochaetales bacterium]|jgi:cytoskeletal protein CcmA (bactofilin family)|nr:polymer-forming cytoskeletal protein [Spirochaetales bacterium]
MSDHLIADGSFINSIVGDGTRFKGELKLNGLLRIDGDFLGTIKTPDKVLIGKGGRAECTIEAGTVVIGGILKGNIIATEKVIILSTGILLGNVSAPRLIVEEGVILDGSCTISNEQDKKESAAFGKGGNNSFNPFRSRGKNSADRGRWTG